MLTPDLTPFFLHALGVLAGLALVLLMWKVLPPFVSEYIDEDYDVRRPLKGEVVPVKSHLSQLSDEALINRFMDGLGHDLNDHDLYYGIGKNGMDWHYRLSEQMLLRALRHTLENTK